MDNKNLEERSNSEKLEENLIETDLDEEFDEYYNDYEPMGGSGFWFKFNEMCYKINKMMQKSLELSVNSANGKWFLLLLAAVSNSAASLTRTSNRLANNASGIIGGFVVALIIWAIEKGVVKYVSRKIGFGYGYKLEYKKERDTLVAYSVLIFSIVSLLLAVLRLSSIPIVGMLIGPIINTIAITSIFYRQLRSKYAKSFAKRFLLFHIILSLVLLLIVAGIVFYVFKQFVLNINDINMMNELNNFNNFLP
ncbi:MAG: hypothetical protein Q4P29_06305 [Tissierellia bacterium]|nr:hypothetical protein [Tissierellia bacterium]